MKKGKVWGKKLVAGIMMAAIVLGNAAVSTQAATKDSGKTVAVIKEDNYRKTLCKGFLGKSYGSVVDGIRCDCSGYTRAALNRLESKGKSGTALKNVQVAARCTRDWVSVSSANAIQISGTSTPSKSKQTISILSSVLTLLPFISDKCCLNYLYSTRIIINDFQLPVYLLFPLKCDHPVHINEQNHRGNKIPKHRFHPHLNFPAFSGICFFYKIVPAPAKPITAEQCQRQ